MPDEELINEIYSEFLLIRRLKDDRAKYQELVFKWVQKYHECEEEFVLALKRLHGNGFCVPNNRLNMQCPSQCSQCHLFLPKKLINRMNTPYK